MCLIDVMCRQQCKLMWMRQPSFEEEYIPKLFDSLTLKGKIVGMSSASKNPILNRNADLCWG
jgi:hypothetical protein